MFGYIVSHRWSDDENVAGILNIVIFIIINSRFVVISSCRLLFYSSILCTSTTKYRQICIYPPKIRSESL